MNEYRIQRRRPGRFLRLVEDATFDPDVRVVHGPIAGSGVDAVQSFRILAGSIRQAKTTADRLWELSMDSILLESVTMSETAVDETAGVIKNVKIAGLESPSKNRRYQPGALRAAVPLFEGVSVNSDHDRENKGRKIADRFGVLQNVRFMEGDGLRGDLRYNVKHPLAPQVGWWAANLPSQIGLSQHSFGACRRENGVEIVEQIRSVKSVDLVSDPATTRGLFEDKNEHASEIASVIADVSLDKAAKLRRINELLESSGLPTPPKKKDRNMALEASEITIEMIESRSDLVDALSKRIRAQIEKESKTTELLEENASLKKKLDELTVAQAIAASRAKIETLLVESKLPEAAITKTFRETLEAAGDETKIKALIEDRVAVVGRSSSPKSREQSMSEATGRKDGEKVSIDDVVRALKS